MKLLSSSRVIIVELSSACSMAIRAAPKAPISPATLGLITFLSETNSKALSTELLRKVPPCTTIFLPNSSLFFIFITLKRVFFTTE